VVGLVLLALLTAPFPSLLDFQSSAPALDLGLSSPFWLVGTSSILCRCILQTPLFTLLPRWFLRVPGLRPTCMNAVVILVECVRSAISGLRALASSLEAGLHNYEASLASGHLELDIESQGPLDADSRVWTSPIPRSVGSAPSSAARASDCSGSYRTVESSLSKAPAYCFDLCRALQGPPEDVAHRVQRAWEAGLWSKATIEGQIPKPRPTPKIALRPACYVVVRAPGVSSPVWVSSSREFFRLVPRFTDDTITHAFPSAAEGRVFCAALGIAFPEQKCLP